MTEHFPNAAHAFQRVKNFLGGERVLTPEEQQANRALAHSGLVAISRTLSHIEKGGKPTVGVWVRDNTLLFDVADQIMLGYNGTSVFARLLHTKPEDAASFSMEHYNQKGNEIYEATVQVTNEEGRPLSYSLALAPEDPLFQDDAIVRQLARDILGKIPYFHQTMWEDVETIYEEHIRDNEERKQKNEDPKPFSYAQVLDFFQHVPFCDFTPLLEPLPPYNESLLPTDKTVVYPDEVEYKTQSRELAVTLTSTLSHLTHLKPSHPVIHPDYVAHPDIAQYVSGNSVLVYADEYEGPVGIITAQPEKGRVIFQVATGSQHAVPTLYLTDLQFLNSLQPKNSQSSEDTLPKDSPPLLDTQSVAIGFSRYGYPHQPEALFPITKEVLQTITDAIPHLAKRLAADKTLEGRDPINFPLPLTDIRGMPFVELTPERFSDFVERILQAAIPDKEATRIETIFEDNVPQKATVRNSEIADYVVTLEQQGLTRQTSLWFDEARQTTTVVFGIDSEKVKGSTSVSFDCDGLRINGYLITEKLLRETPEWEKRLQRMAVYMQHFEDAWKIVQNQHSRFITEEARYNIASLITDLWHLVDRQGQVPFMTPYLGGSVNPLVTASPLSAEWLKEPLFAERDTYDPTIIPGDSFLGSLAEAKMRDHLGDMPTAVQKAFSVKDFVDPDDLEASPFMRSLGEETDTTLESVDNASTTPQNISSEEQDVVQQPEISLTSTPPNFLKSEIEPATEDEGLTAMIQHFLIATPEDTQKEAVESAQVNPPQRRRRTVLSASSQTAQKGKSLSSKQSRGKSATPLAAQRVRSQRSDAPKRKPLSS